jgi:SAM-dependent methyltransferase
MRTYCEACLSDERSLEIRGSKYGLIKCGTCGLVTTDPMPTDEELVDYYQGFSFNLESPQILKGQLSAIERSLRHFVGEGPGRFLDYGGGCGIYTVAAKNLGWSSELFDYDKGMIDFAKQELGVQKGFSDWMGVTGSFDLIFAFHVIEHWNSLTHHFEELLNRLSPGGSLVFATPNARSVEKIARHRHRESYENILIDKGASRDQACEILARHDSVTCWDPPRHLYAFTPESLKQLGQRYDLKTHVWTGYNTSSIFEPRRYVIPTLKNTLAGQVRQILKHPRQTLKNIKPYIKLRIAISRLKATYPEMGEQLYVKFIKPRNDENI